MKGYKEKSRGVEENGAPSRDIRRLAITAIGSLIVHSLLLGFVFVCASKSSAKQIAAYRVSVRRLPVQKKDIEVPPLPKAQPKKEPEALRKELPKEPERIEEKKPVPPIPPPPEEITKPIPLPVAQAPLQQNAVIEKPAEPIPEKAGAEPAGSPGTGGGNSLFAAGTGKPGWGGPGEGIGWGGGAGSRGSGGGSGGGMGSGTGSGVKGYSAGDPGISLPGYAENPRPVYPQDSKSRREHGNVLLKVEVLANGRVGTVELETSSGYSTLDKSALETVKRWKFIPAKKGKEAVICWVNIPIKFELRGE